jgi:hypothetical protein
MSDERINKRWYNVEKIVMPWIFIGLVAVGAAVFIGASVLALCGTFGGASGHYQKVPALLGAVAMASGALFVAVGTFCLSKGVSQ